MTNSKMILEIKEGVGYITFNNPEKHNAVSLEMWETLGEMMLQLERDNNVRVVVLKGAGGKSFVSGADISKFDKDRSSKEQVLNYNKRTGKIYHRIETFPKPTNKTLDFIFAWFNNFFGIETLPSLSKLRLILSERTEVAK